MRLVWSLPAINDRVAIFDHIEQDSAEAATTADDRIEAQVEILEQFPEIGRPGRIGGTREFVIQRTPYIAVYRVTAEGVLILRVIHGARQWPGETDEI